MNFEKLKDTFRKMFLEEWDPIGIRDEPHAVDEYDSYADELAEAVIQKSVIDESMIHDYLCWGVYEHIGLSQTDFQDRKSTVFAKKISEYLASIR